MKRVVVTGMGSVTPFGVGVNLLWKNLVDGHSCVDSIRRFDCSKLKCKIGGVIPDIQYENHLNIINSSKFDTATLIAMIAIQEALQEAHFEAHEISSLGLILGTGFGTIQTKEENFVNTLTFHKPIYSLIVLKAMDNAIAGEAAIQFGLKGINQTVFTACSSGLNAIGNAYRLIRSGYEECIVAGGVDTPITFYMMESWGRLRILSTKNNAPKNACKPFCADRDGIVLAEGAAFLVLEEYERAKNRGAKILCELVGFSTNCDAKHITTPDYKQQALVISKTLKDANITMNEIDYINAHGTATIINDRIETLAIKEVFGENNMIPISATKSQLGHAMGASGAIETICTIKMMENDMVLPTINLNKTDPDCDMNFVANSIRKIKVNYALKNSFGFGGNNAALVLKKY